MNYWKIVAGAAAIMWGTEAECNNYQAQVNAEGGNAKVERCTQEDIDQICRRAML